MEGISAFYFNFIALTMLLTGVSTMSLRDFMDVQHFHFPIHWVWLTVVGYALALPMHRLTKKSDQGHLPFVHNDAHAMPLKVYILCMILDTAAMACAYMAMGIISAAVVQMMRGFKLIITFGVSAGIQNKPQERKHYAGVCMVLMGLMIVAAGSLQDHSPPAGSTEQTHKGALEKGGDRHGIVGALALCLLSELFMAGSYLYQDFVVKKYDAPTLQIVGMMGVTGVVFFTALLAVLNGFNIESTPGAVEKVMKSWPLALTVLIYTLALPVYELAGLMVSKHGNPVVRALIDVTRGALIWGVELFYHWVNFEILHLIGFSIIATGTMVYVGGIRLPFMSEEDKLGETAKLVDVPESDMLKKKASTSSASSDVSTAASSPGASPLRLG